VNTCREMYQLIGRLYIKKTWSLSDPARNASGSVFVLGEAEGPQP